jgi:hypothetical protein
LAAATGSGVASTVVGATTSAATYTGLATGVVCKIPVVNEVAYVLTTFVTFLSYLFFGNIVGASSIYDAAATLSNAVATLSNAEATLSDAASSSSTKPLQNPAKSL